MDWAIVSCSSLGCVFSAVLFLTKSPRFLRTCFIQLEGLNILTDPVFGYVQTNHTVLWCCDKSDRIGIHSHRTLDSVLGPARLRPPPCPLSSFIAIDIVLVSHSHPDHLDYHVVDFLGNSVRWFVPIGLGDWFRRRGVWRVREMAWWDKDVAEVEGEDGGKIDIIATPAMVSIVVMPLKFH